MSIQQYWSEYAPTDLTSENISFLKKLKRFLADDDVIIAGGAIRDAYFEKPISDIDIYYQHSLDRGVDGPQLENSETLKKLLLPLAKAGSIASVDVKAVTPRDSRGWKPSDYYSFRFIRSIVDVVHSGQRYQLMATSMPPVEFVQKHFDVNLCRCWYDGVRMRYTGAFLRDARNKTLTIEGEMTKGEYKTMLNIHIPKLKEKYPDFTVIDTLRTKNWRE